MDDKEKGLYNKTLHWTSKQRVYITKHYIGRAVKGITVYNDTLQWTSSQRDFITTLHWTSSQRDYITKHFSGRAIKRRSCHTEVNRTYSSYNTS